MESFLRLTTVIALPLGPEYYIPRCPSQIPLLRKDQRTHGFYSISLAACVSELGSYTVCFLEANLLDRVQR